MKKSAKPFMGTFSPEDGATPIRTGCAGVVFGYRLEGGRHYRFRTPVAVEKGDTISYRSGRGVCVNGAWTRPKADRWAPKTVVIGWVARRLRVAVWLSRGRLWAPGTKDHGKPTANWVAADLRSYHIAQGKTSIEAFKSLIAVVCFTERMAKAERRKGRTVLRERTHLRAKDHIAQMEAEARKAGGMIVDGVEWRESA